MSKALFFMCQWIFSHRSGAFEEEACVLLSLSDMFQCGWVFMCMAAILTNEKLLLLSSSTFAVIFWHNWPNPTLTASHDQSVSV